MNKNKKKVNIFTKSRKSKLDKAFKMFDKDQISQAELKKIYKRVEMDLEVFFIDETYKKLDDMVDFLKEFLYKTPYVHKKMFVNKQPTLQLLIDEFHHKIYQFKIETDSLKMKQIVLEMQEIAKKAKLFDYDLVDNLYF